MNNNRKIFAPLGASNHVSSDREPNDYYATDPVAAEALLKLERLNPYIWEPACGEGHLSRVFTKSGHHVKSTDLIDRGFGEGGIDFLQATDKWHGDIVTNPPYKYAKQFVEKGLELVDDGGKVCMFLKLTFLEGKNRYYMFQEHPITRLHVSSARITCSKNAEDFNASTAAANGWFVWEKGYTGKPTIDWFMV